MIPRDTSSQWDSAVIIWVVDSDLFHLTLKKGGAKRIMTPEIERLFRSHISVLSPESRLALVAGMAEDLAESTAVMDSPQKHRLEKVIWESIDPDQYVESLRSEWDKRL